MSFDSRSEEKETVEEIMAKLGKDTDSHIQEAKQTPNKLNSKKTTQIHMMKLHIMKSKINKNKKLLDTFLYVFPFN